MTAKAVLFCYTAEGRVFADEFTPPRFPDPVRAAENLKRSIVDDLPGALWSIGLNEEARDIMTNTRMREMGFEGYDHAEAKRA